MPRFATPETKPRPHARPVARASRTQRVTRAASSSRTSRPSKRPSQRGLQAPTLSRRTLFKGAAALGGVAALAGTIAGTAATLGGCSQTAGDEVAEPTYVEDGAQTSVLDTYTYVENPPGLTEAGSWSVPLGTVLHPSEGAWIAATATGEANLPPVKASAFSLASGELVDVVPKAVGKGSNVMIVDARCSDSVFAWCESDVVTRAWTLFAAPFEGGALASDPTELWSADADWDLPLFAVAGDRVIYQVMPLATGQKSTEDSTCYVWHKGQGKATAAIVSHGRFATEPAVSQGTVTLTPRVREDEGVYYGIYAYELSDDLSHVVDSMVLPQSVKPMSAVRMGEDFVFQVEANYQSGGLLGNMGTYLGKSGGPFVAISREPSTPAAGKFPIVIVKSRSSYVDADVDTQQYGVVPALDHSVDYGEYPARVGTCDTFVSFATVKDPDTGFPANVQVRAFAVG